MNKNFFLELADYTIWVNNKVIDWLYQINEEQWEQHINSSFSSIKQTTLHIVSAEKIWIDFWKNTPHPVFLFGEFKGTKNDLIDMWKKISSDLKNLIENYPEDKYLQQVHFKFKEQEWQMEFWQTFSHCINHATYHRGQLVTLLRQAGFTNLSSTDLATYYRLSKSNPIAL